MDKEIKNAKILIVDDEPKNIELLRQALTNSGYQNLKATSDSREVCSIFTEFEPDLILLDLRMPHMDGFAVMEQLQNIAGDRYISILILTAQHDNETCLRALSSGGKDFMGKPLNLFELLSRIKNLLEIHLLQKQLRNQNQILEQTVQERTAELHDTRLSIIQRLGRAAEYRDNETGNHVIRMSQYSALLARKLGLDAKHCDLILNAAPMHDIGKIGIPDRILLKPGKLDHNEWQIMKTHAAIGGEILSGDNSDLLRMAQTTALQHHEKYDGSGYPNGLAGEKIALECRIVTICDVFDALTSERPYKKAWSIENALAEIDKQSGSMFDPKLVMAFKEILPEALAIRKKYTDEF